MVPKPFLYICLVISLIALLVSRGFKALKQTVKLYYRLARYQEMMDSYRVMLTYIRSAVTRNYSEKCINNIMDFVSGSASQNFSLLREFYQITLKALEDAKNEVSLWYCPCNHFVFYIKCKLLFTCSAETLVQDEP